ncbi:MAG: N-acylglucosamine 2-epimerase, partial [Bacteroidales bacterium]|nr:N-acylglucosamine 2-epimerase [Bacteroidales bacterium]
MKASNRKEVFYNEIVKDLKYNILPFWEKYSVDEKGGFYGALAYDGSPVENADKGCVLNARILWTFSIAYQVFKNPQYLNLANRAQQYLIDHFIDKEMGGVYWTLDSRGIPKDKDKQTYGIAFAIYGLSEHYRATQSQKSLDEAIALYYCLENIAFDSENGGYIESFTKDWQKPNRYGYDGDGIASKTMNTHIHVLEAYTNLYQVWKDEGLRKQLSALLNVLIEKVYNPSSHHLMLYFNDAWESLEDIDSYGHDIETAWLINETA